MIKKRLEKLESEVPSKKLYGTSMGDFYKMLEDPKHKARFDAWYNPNRKTSLS